MHEVASQPGPGDDPSPAGVPEAVSRADAAQHEMMRELFAPVAAAEKSLRRAEWTQLLLMILGFAVMVAAGVLAQDRRWALGLGVAFGAMTFCFGLNTSRIAARRGALRFELEQAATRTAHSAFATAHGIVAHGIAAASEASGPAGDDGADRPRPLPRQATPDQQ